MASASLDDVGFRSEGVDTYAQPAVFDLGRQVMSKHSDLRYPQDALHRSQMISPRNDVQKYLAIFCPVAREGNVSILGDRAANQAFMKKHDLSLADIQAYLADLRVEDYSSGPEDDDDPVRRGLCQIWKFGPDFCDAPLYVKLADWLQNRPKRHHCVSFKEASPALTLPYL